MTPFEHFFAEDFPRRLADIRHEPGLLSTTTSTIRDTSWDRQAAFLLWDALGRPTSAPKMPKIQFEDLL